ncbi:unnamed protein product [Caenorhabditis auriculariae]|uniref:MSP domain-containing protein n=1 Tax=Caenorhabditis auriculariae TaxID=2777116 RepID=A0A8S1GXT8_9PELO|nr:unnamed protein product [Caenorhabditis auriculariae]
MALSADPAAISVPAAGGKSELKLNNGGGEKLVFKVKSSNNNEYRINPVFGFVDASGSTGVVITRLNGAAKEDKLVIQFGAAPADAADAQAAFGAVSASAASVTVALSAT